MKAVKRQNLNEMVMGRIKSFSTEWNLRPGDRLPTEREVTDEFDISRGSILEATKTLSFLGIIHSAPRRGFARPMWTCRASWLT
ncbi:MAG: GntR family transcriptional regulator [Planctomycetes bacterium]|nr:GntR family transcriptional regulator [Planctomycetota bacterium]